MLMHKNIIHTYIYILFLYSIPELTKQTLQNLSVFGALRTQLSQLLRNFYALAFIFISSCYIVYNNLLLRYLATYSQLCSIYTCSQFLFQVCKFVSLFMIKNQAFLFLARKVLLWAQQLYVQCLLKGYLFRKSLSQEILFSLTNTHTITVSQSNNEHYFC